MKITKHNIKGRLCSINGKKYELKILNIVKNCELNNNKFNTQTEKDLGGSNSKNDIECNMNNIKIPIEIKKKKSPDWMQCSLKYDIINKKWRGSNKNRIPNNSKLIFQELISNIELFNNRIPPFMIHNITHNDWIKIKKNTTDYNDQYIDCYNNIIQKLYKEKGCYYIQISDKGLYHLGEDICNFNVPEFTCPQELRIRTKIHSKKNKKGFCKLSVIIACKPKNINYLINSPYSLDDIDKLPYNLKYNIINC